MEESEIAFGVRRAGQHTAVIDVAGDVTPSAEAALMHAYGEATSQDTRSVVLDFSDLAYMNSGGIGLLVTLLVRAQRGHQELRAFGLNEHYRQILSLTRLDEAITIHADETSALAAADG